MCITPSNVEVKGEIVQVPCRSCWQCRNNRVNDLIGRCLAEQEAARQTLAVTLTYNDNAGASAAVLVYKDVQDFLKRLRRAGYEVRYIVAGEYGSRKGRAHWHMILFLHGETLKEQSDPVERKPWEIVLPRYDNDHAARIQWAPWSNEEEGRGFVYFQRPDYGGFKYLLKYVLKEQAQAVAQTHLAMSKKPPLGYDFFIDMAERYAKAGLVPSNAEYAFKDQIDAKGKRRKFHLQGRMRELFLDAFEIAWSKYQGETMMPESEFVIGYMDKKLESEIKDYDPAEWAGHFARKAQNMVLGEAETQFVAKWPIVSSFEKNRYESEYQEGWYGGKWVELVIWPGGIYARHHRSEKQWQSEKPREIQRFLQKFKPEKVFRLGRHYRDLEQRGEDRVMQRENSLYKLMREKS